MIKGVTGIGPVKAIEIVNEWSGDKLEGLNAFKTWCLNQQNFLPIEDHEDTVFKSKYKNAAKKIDFPHKFPDPNVYECYANPDIDKNMTPFKWGHVDLDGIRDYLEDKIGWGRTKVDEILLPVMKEINRKAESGKLIQRKIDQYFVPHASEHKSKRIRDALDNWGTKSDIGMKKADKPKKKSRSKED